MRLNYKSLVMTVIIVFISFFYPSKDVKSENRSLLIKQYNVNAQIQNSGDMKVEENINFAFNGSYNGITKQIILPEAAGIENISVSEDGKGYKNVSSAAKGESGVFMVEDQGNNSYTLWIYKPSANITRNFKITYTIKSACDKYIDTGELYWKFIGTENQTPMQSVSIDIVLPQGSHREDIKLFAHGPLTGQSVIVDDRTLNLSINNLPSARYVEARVLFPPELISKSSKVFNEKKLQSILEEEAALADEANRQRQQARDEINNPPYSNNNDFPGGMVSYRRKPTYIAGYLGVLAALAALFFGVRIKNRYGMEPKPDFHGEYYRELPGDYTPTVMSMLYFGNVSPRDITATLMNLIRKRHLKLDIIDIEKKGLFSKNHRKDYVVSKMYNEKDKLLPHEEFLLNWLLNDFGNGNSFTFDEIKSGTKGSREAVQFRKKYNRWTQIAKEDSLNFGFWDDSGRKGTALAQAAAVLGVILLAVIFFITGMSPIGFVLFGASIVGLVILSFTFTKRTQYGANQYARWKGFRNFLKDFGNLKEAEVPSLVLWEHYLVYAISLDIAKQVLEQLRIVIPSEDIYSNTNMNMLTYLYISDMMHGHNSIFEQFEDISAAFTEITDSAISVANSQDSSSTGGGGGFSGGGFGGGSSGGGGGGFGGF